MGSPRGNDETPPRKCKSNQWTLKCRVRYVKCVRSWEGHSRVPAAGSDEQWPWRWTWVSLKDRRWRSAQTNSVQVVAEVIRSRPDPRAACRPPGTASQDVTDYPVTCLATHGPGPAPGGHCLSPSLRSFPEDWLPGPPASGKEGGSPAITLVNQPDTSYWRTLTLPPTTKQQQTLFWALTCRVGSSLRAHLLQRQDGEALHCPKSSLYPPCSCPFCDFFHWNSIEDQQWAKYHAGHG